MAVTGSSVNSQVNAELPDIISRVREYSTVPLAVGFGVATSQHFNTIADAGADAIVIGSRLVTIIRESPKGQIPQHVEAYCRDIGMNKASRRHLPIPVHHPSPLPALEKSLATLPMRFGQFGGQYVPEGLLSCLAELEQAYVAATLDPTFWKEFEGLYSYINRPSKLGFAGGLTKEGGGARIWLKREDL
jgi:tryptophan synthase